MYEHFLKVYGITILVTPAQYELWSYVPEYHDRVFMNESLAQSRKVIDNVDHEVTIKKDN